MIANSERTVLISSMGWVDHDALWIFDVSARTESRVSLGTGAKYLSLHLSQPNYFAVGHHFDGARYEITVHRFSEPTQAIARAVITQSERALSGDSQSWKQVPC